MSTESTTKKRDRVIALSMAILFFAFASSLTIAIVVSAIASRHKTSASTANTATSSAQSAVGTQLANFTPVNSVSTLQSTDTKVGTGATAQPGDTVTVDYTGAVASTGLIFQTTKGNQPVSLSLSQVIKGWQDGIPGMKVGGTRRLLIPANEAYGANPPSGSGIPANAALVFDVTLDKVGS